MILNAELMHYGTPRRSGRYPWGSGEDPYQRNISFLSYINEQLKAGLSEKEIARQVGMTTTELRQRKTLAIEEKRAADVAQVIRLKEKGYSNVAIGERMGINESTVRSLQNTFISERQKITKATADMLKSQVAEKGFIDVGLGVENHLGISKTKLNTAIYSLENEGYTIHYFKVPQIGVPGNYTSIKALAAPGVPYSGDNKEKVKTITDRSVDLGRSWLGLEPIQSVKSDRVKIRYGPEGGEAKDGVIELRRGVEDLNLGNARYAQVRIGVNDTHYLKGMAIYSDNMPDGIDIVFNTNKKPDVPMMSDDPKNSVLKGLKTDPDNPFGAQLKKEIDAEGNSLWAQRGALNIVNEEGDWGEWSKTISSQMLSKQPPALAKQQLGLNYSLKKEEFDDYMALTNPEIKKSLLMKFADSCDSSASHLEAAGFPRQRWQVILPIEKLKENEIYAPNFENGEKVVLIRYPHGGKFEIPELTVNNKSKDAKAIMDRAADAVGIHPKTAQILSGADFDGDTVLVIPNKNQQIKTSSRLKQLENFDHLEMYKGFEGMITPGAPGSGYNRGVQMGSVSNLITDMTIKGAPDDEIARAVRHSMVVIDADKHNLNYKLSYEQNGIASLKEKYQGGARRGASTIISRAESEERVPQRTEISPDPVTGERRYKITAEPYTRVTKTGIEKTIYPTTKSTKMRETKDAFQLSSGTTIESVYATHANQLKDLANTARREAMAVKTPPYSPSARIVYQKEVNSLNAQLNRALQNKPMERQAQIYANSVVKKKIEANPGITAADIKRIKGQALAEGRVRSGASKRMIVIEPREWEAIQARALSSNAITQILNNTKPELVKQYATPRTLKGVSDVRIARAKSMLNNGFTQAEVADALGISTTTLANALK